MIKNIKNYTLDELKEEFKKLDEKSYRAEQIYEWIYKKKVNIIKLSGWHLQDIIKTHLVSLNIRAKIIPRYSLSKTMVRSIKTKLTLP